LKESNTSYLLDDPVLHGMVTMLAMGDIDWDNLTDDEHEAIRPILEQGHPHFGR
jgi:hypothetical protein